MKKLAISLLLVGVTIYAQQTAQAQVRFGIKAGVNASNAKFQRNLDFDPLPGYQAGLQVDISLSPNISIQPALLYVSKGFSTELEFRNMLGQSTGNFRASFRPNYLEIPVLVLYKAKVGNTCKIFGGLGPYAAAGLGGKSSLNFTTTGPTQDIVFRPKSSHSQDTYNLMDYGLVGTIGLEMRRVSLAVNSSHGMTGIGPGSIIVGAGAFYNRSLGLSAGYWFGE